MSWFIIMLAVSIAALVNKYCFTSQHYTNFNIRRHYLCTLPNIFSINFTSTIMFTSIDMLASMIRIYKHCQHYCLTLAPLMYLPSLPILLHVSANTSLSYQSTLIYLHVNLATLSAVIFPAVLCLPAFVAYAYQRYMILYPRQDRQH